MPYYGFSCPACEHEEIVLRSISNRNDVLLCPEDGFVMERDFSVHHKIKSAVCASTFFSSTMGVHPDQIADEVRRHPDWKFDKEGRLEICGLADQRQKIRELGMINRDDNK